MALRDDVDLVLDVENRRRAALVAVDLIELGRLFSEDLVHVHSTGLVHSKPELLQHINQKRAFLAIERGPLHIRVEGDIAIMTGTMTNRMRANEGNGQIFLHGFVTQVLRRSADGWRFISFQLTPLREQ